MKTLWAVSLGMSVLLNIALLSRTGKAAGLDVPAAKAKPPEARPLPPQPVESPRAAPAGLSTAASPPREVEWEAPSRELSRLKEDVEAYRVVLNEEGAKGRSAELARFRDLQSRLESFSASRVAHGIAVESGEVVPMEVEYLDAQGLAHASEALADYLALSSPERLRFARLFDDALSRLRQGKRDWDDEMRSLDGLSRIDPEAYSERYEASSRILTARAREDMRELTAYLETREGLPSAILRIHLQNVFERMAFLAEQAR